MTLPAVLGIVSWLAFAVLPGLAVLRLLRIQLPLSAAAAMAAPVSFGGVYLVGLVATRLGLSVQVCCLVSIGGLVSGWAGAEISRSRRRREHVAVASVAVADGRRQLDGEKVVGTALLIAAVVLGLVLWSGLHSALTVPAGWDAMHHGYFARQIVDRDTLAASVVLSSDPGTADGTAGFYPLAFNLAAALLHQISGLPISVLLLASTPAIAGVLLPWSTYHLVRTMTRPLTAGFAAVATVLPINLYTIEYTGRITAVLGLAIVPAAGALLLIAGRSLTYRFWVVSALTTIGVTGVHTSETPLLFAIVVVIAVVRTCSTRSWRWLIRFLAALLGSALAAAVVLVLVEPGVLHLVGERSGALGPDGGRQRLGAALRSLLTEPQFHHQGMMLFTSLALVGSLLTVVPRWGRLRGPALCHLGFAGFYLAFVTGWLGPLSFLGIPWYRDPARMMWVLSLLGAVPVGVTLTALADVSQRGIAAVGRRFDRERKAVARLAFWVPPIVLLAAVLVVGTPAVRTESVRLLKPTSPVTPDYQAAFRYLADHQRPGRRVLDDLRNHGDLWMFVDDDVPTLLGNAPLIGLAPDSWKERLYLRGKLSEIGTDPCVGRLLRTYQVSYVFFADQLVDGGTPRISAATLGNTKYFREVFTRGGAHVFQVIPPVESGDCRTDLTTQFPWSTVADAN